MTLELALMEDSEDCEAGMLADDSDVNSSNKGWVKVSKGIKGE